MPRDAHSKKMRILLARLNLSLIRCATACVLWATGKKRRNIVSLFNYIHRFAHQFGL